MERAVGERPAARGLVDRMIRWFCLHCDATQPGSAPNTCPQCGSYSLEETDAPVQAPTRLGYKSSTHVIKAIFKS